MSYPLANLGDYNIARTTLKAAGGDWTVLYNSIGRTAVAKATPKLIVGGGLIGAGFVCLLWVGNEVRRFCKERKQLVQGESALKKEFAETLEANSSLETEELIDDGE